VPGVTGRYIVLQRAALLIISIHMRSRFYRGHRIHVVQLGLTWNAIVHDHTGAIIRNIEANSLAEAIGQAEWFIEKRLAFRPPAQGERMAG
jgi:hypothetical protein